MSDAKRINEEYFNGKCFPVDGKPITMFGNNEIPELRLQIAEKLKNGIIRFGDGSYLVVPTEYTDELKMKYPEIHRKTNNTKASRYMFISRLARKWDISEGSIDPELKERLERLVVEVSSREELEEKVRSLLREI